MARSWRVLRSRLLSPSRSEVSFAKRGFAPGEPEAVRRLEKSATHFVMGFEEAMAAKNVADTGRRLDGLTRPLQGFAYEGAAMALTILDAVDPVRHGRLPAFLAGPGEPHEYMAVVGNGWALARLPKWRWRTVLPADPLLRWLALDGYGFHEAFFHTERYVYRREPWQVPPQWPGPAAYAARVFDQGVGRAMWFVCAADVERLSDAVLGFPAARQPDLWAGIGLAATYAGGGDPDKLELLRLHAGQDVLSLCQGSAFAAKARLRAGLSTSETEVVVRALCGMSADRAAAVTGEALTGLPADGGIPAFEHWRVRIQRGLANEQER
jgi:enediyne biosynthesis protein E3